MNTEQRKWEVANWVVSLSEEEQQQVIQLGSYFAKLPEERRREFFPKVFLDIGRDVMKLKKDADALLYESNRLKAQANQHPIQAEHLKARAEKLAEQARQLCPDEQFLSELLKQLTPDSLLSVFASGQRRWMDWYVRYQERREPTPWVKDAQQAFKQLADQYANLEIIVSNFANVSPAERRRMMEDLVLKDYPRIQEAENRAHGVLDDVGM